MGVFKLKWYNYFANNQIATNSENLLKKNRDKMMYSQLLDGFSGALRDCRKFKFLNFLTNQPF